MGSNEAIAQPPDWYRSAEVTQADYNPQWPSQYQAEAQIVAVAIGKDLVSIEHVGSTAVPGLSGKPIIDILAGVSTWDRFDTIVAALGETGYVYTPHAEADDPGRRVFRKPADMALTRTHHLHITEFNSAYWKRIIAFRDHLRAHRADAAAYADLKRRLAAEFAGSVRNGYTQAKKEFVREIERKAQAATAADPGHRQDGTRP